MVKKIKNLVASLLVIGFVLTPFSAYVKVAHAQTTGYTGNISGYGYSSHANGGNGLVGYITGAANVITQLPLCKAVLPNAIKHLFNPKIIQPISVLPIKGVTGSPSGLSENGIRNIKPSQQTLDAIAKSQGVQTTNPALEEKADRTLLGIADLQETSRSINENDTCLMSIGRLVIKRLLQKITVSTVQWIQSGREGSPFFVAHLGEFMGDLAKTEILRFGVDISDPNLFPFGKAYMQRQANYYNRRFTENARYSLNELIQETTPQYNANDFRGDFSKGGWNGWLGITQVPANNPLGFELMASEELGAKINNVVDETNKMLEQSGGFLGDQRCVDSSGSGTITHEKDKEALISGQKIPIYDPENGKVVGYDVVGTCKRWEYVTPGKMISEAATNLVDYPSNNLLSANDLNDAVAAILDALLAKWTPEVINKGFANLGTGGADGYLVIDEDQFNHNYLPTQVESDFSAGSIRGWLADNPHFNIRSDLNQALIDEQRTYIDKAKQENKVLDDLITTVYQLDYCIPGPHPGWEQDSRGILSAAENAMVSKTPADMEGIDLADVEGLLKTAGNVVGMAIAAKLAIAGSLAGPVGTLIGAGIGLIIGAVLGLLDGDSNEQKLAAYYSGLVGIASGIHVDHTGNDSAKLANKQEVTGGLDKIYVDYVKLIHKYFTPGFLPTITPEATVKFGQIPGYKQIQEDNNDQVVALNGVVQRLGTLKEEVDKLNAELGISPTPDQLDAYEAKLKPIANEFARLSQDMVSGDNIAFIDSSLKQAKDEIKYVFTDLIKGQYGCEQDLEFNRQPLLKVDERVYPPITPPVNPSKTALLRSTLRAEYPFKLWYDYNIYSPGTALPVPQQLVQYLDPNPITPLPTTHMPSYPIGEHGPGFLSTVYFSYTNKAGEGQSGPSCTGRLLNSYELDCIDAVAAFKEVDSNQVTVGRNKNFNLAHESTTGNGPGGTQNQQKDVSFEQTIYVY